MTEGEKTKVLILGLTPSTVPMLLRLREHILCDQPLLLNGGIYECGVGWPMVVAAGLAEFEADARSTCLLHKWFANLDPFIFSSSGAIISYTNALQNSTAGDVLVAVNMLLEINGHATPA